jgi:two-component system cell cycle sensor histidine kinase/response regulator CckA
MESSSSAEEPKSRPAILVVDDDPDVLMFIVATLRRHGYNVFGAQSGPEAMSVLMQQKHLIGIVLTDVVMPSLNGPELAQRLVAVNPGLTVLYMSGYKEEHLARFGTLLNDCSVLSKPFTPQELLGAIHKCMGGPPATKSAGS